MNRFMVIIFALVTILSGPSFGAELTFMHRPINSESEELAREFYQGQWDLSSMRQELKKKLANQRGDCRLNELAGQVEWLLGNDGAAFKHYIQAATDDSCQQGNLNLFRISGLILNQNEKALFEEGLLFIIKNSQDQLRRKTAADLLTILYEERGTSIKKVPTWPKITNWRILGSFDNDHGKGFKTIYNPETELVEQAHYTEGKLHDLSWRDVQADDGLLPLDFLLSPNEQAVTYAKTYISVPNEGDYLLHVHSTASTSVWINQQQLFSYEYLEVNNFDNIVIPVKLHTGLNKLLIKSAVLEQRWELAAYLTDLSGQPVDYSSQSADTEFSLATISFSSSTSSLGTVNTASQ